MANITNLAAPIADTKNKPPYEVMKTHYNSSYILEAELGMEMVGTDELGTFYKHPDANSKNSAHVFYDSGVIRVFTDKLEPLLPNTDYTTIQLMTEVMEVDPMVYGREQGWIKNAQEKVTSSHDLVPHSSAGLSELLIEYKDHKPSPPLFANFISRKAVTFLFGTAGTGKTFLCMDIAHSLATGTSMPPIDAPEPTEVLYVNFELTNEQLVSRYRHQPIMRSDNLHVSSESVINDPDWTIAKLDSYIDGEVEKYPNIGTIFIDNITYLIDNATEGADAIGFGKALKALAMKHNVAMVIVNHTPKRDENLPMHIDSMSGSGRLKDLADHVIGLRNSMQMRDHILIMEFKNRHARIKLSHDEIPLIEKVVANAGGDEYVELVFRGLTSEEEHLKLKTTTKGVKDVLKKQMITIAHNMRDLNYTIKETAQVLGVTDRTINRYFETNLTQPKR